MAASIVGKVCHFGSRINQLDAVSLDKELQSLLKSQISNCFLHLQHNKLLKIEPELTALLKLIIWKFSVLSKGATIGQQLLDLKYRNEATGKLLPVMKSWILGILVIGAPWLKQRILDNSLTSNISTRQLLNLLLDFAELVFSIGNLINFLIFIHKGKFVSVVERLFGVGRMTSGPQTLREVQYEYMNRELLWHGFAEFLSFILPLINFQRIRNALKRTVFTQSTTLAFSSRTASDLQMCGICEQWPTFPHDIGCQHVFCYYCIMSNSMADPHYQCPVCNYRNNNVSVKPVHMLTCS